MGIRRRLQCRPSGGSSINCGLSLTSRLQRRGARHPLLLLVNHVSNIVLHEYIANSANLLLNS